MMNLDVLVLLCMSPYLAARRVPNAGTRAGEGLGDGRQARWMIKSHILEIWWHENTG